MSNQPVTVKQAADHVGISPRSVYRDLDAGAPAVCRGRGRGNFTLIDMAAYSAWRGARDGDRRFLAVAGDVPDIIASAMHAAFVATSGPHKRAVAGVLAGAGYLAATAVLDRMRVDLAEVSDVSVLPVKLARLRHIFND